MKSNVEEILLVPESTMNFIVKENELLRECIEKALSYIEQHDLYNVDWDYNYENYEEELEYRVKPQTLPIIITNKTAN